MNPGGIHDPDGTLPDSEEFQGLKITESLDASGEFLESENLMKFFSGTILDILRQNPDATEEDILRILKEKGAREKIEKLKSEKSEESHTGEKERDYQLLLNLAPDAFFHGNKKGDFISVNEKAILLTGYTEEELLTMNIKELFSSSLLNQKPLRYDLLDQGKVIVTEREIVKKDGTLVSVEMSSRKMPDGNYQSFIRDITARKEIEDALKIAETTYRNLFLNAQVGLFRTAIDTGLIIDTNDSLARFVGFKDREDLLSSGFNLAECYVNLEDRENMLFFLKEYGQVDNLEVPFRCHDGSVKWIRYSAKIIPNKGWIEGVAEDITELKLVEKDLMYNEAELRRQNNLFISLLENLPVGVFMIDALTGTPLLANEKALTLLGRGILPKVDKSNLGEVYSAYKGDSMEIYPPEEMPILRGTRGEKSHVDDMVVVHPDGIKTLLEVFGSPILDESGDTWASLVSFFDITKRRQIEESLKKTEKQLFERRKRDSVSTLAGGIGHDYSNILTVIIGYLESLLVDESLTQEQRDRLKNALTYCDRAAELTRQFKRLSQNTVPELTCMDIYKPAVSVFQILDTTDILIEKTLNVPENEFYIMASESEFHDVLIELGTNAFKAIKARGYKEGNYIRMSAVEYTHDDNSLDIPQGEYIHITFEDNGIGMSEEVLDRAFDPLFTTGEKGVQRGHGLGLATVYNTVKKSGGDITIESKKGVGTSVHIYLPKVAPPKEIPTQIDISEKRIETTKEKETILLIDDEKDLVDLIKEELEFRGYNVLTANDGEEGLGMYIANMNSIDLVILDLTMPKMLGPEVFTKMQKIKKDVRVIIASGGSDEAMKAGVLSLAKGAINKPFSLKELTKIVREVLDGQKS